MEDRQSFFEDVCIPRNEFIKEHVHLIKLLNDGNRKQLLEEAKSQGGELQRILDEAESQGLRGGGFFDWIRKKLGLAPNTGKSNSRVSAISETQGVRRVSIKPYPEEVVGEERKPYVAKPKRQRRIRIPLSEYVTGDPPEPPIYQPKPFRPYLGVNFDTATITSSNPPIRNINKRKWEKQEREKFNKSLKDRQTWYEMYGQWQKYPAGDPTLRTLSTGATRQKPPTSYIPSPEERTYCLTRDSTCIHPDYWSMDPLKVSTRFSGPSVFGRPIYAQHPDRTAFMDEYYQLPAKFKKYTETDEYEVDEEGKPVKGGSRAAGYIKKLIAMYKDGLEVFDIKKMKWASDNLKAFGISMEEDEAPKKKAEEPKEHPAITAYNEALKESIRNSSGMSLARMDFSLTKAENEEMKQLEMQMKEKARSIKTQDEIKAFNKEQKRVLDNFKDRVKKRYREEEARLAELKRASDEAKGMKQKPMTISEGKSFSFGTDDSRDILGAFYNRSKPPPAPAKMAEMEKEAKRAVDFVDKPDWRKAAGYEDPIINKYGVIQNAGNVNSQLPSDYKPDDGWDWLASKYGKLYDLAIDKVKEITRKGRSKWGDREYKDFIRLPFDDIPQMKDFFRDVLLADPILYQYLHLNATRTKAPATTNALREFKKWIGK